MLLLYHSPRRRSSRCKGTICLTSKPPVITLVPRMNSYPQYSIGEQGERPWGSWCVLDMQPNTVVKRLYLVPGGRISLQRHRHRSERWVVLKGAATVLCDNETIHLTKGESAIIPSGAIHRLSNDQREPLEVLEVQIGDLLSEEDIERFTDDYGRVDGASAE